jgi:DNA-binding XRE family transcriptional regulator
MNVALKIHQKLEKKTDIKTIKKIIALYEKLKSKEEEHLSFDEALSHVDHQLDGISAGEKIKAFRSRENLTQKELAFKARVKQQHISEIERGIRPIGVAIAKKLAKAMNCNYKSLL